MGGSSFIEIDRVELLTKEELERLLEAIARDLEEKASRERRRLAQAKRNYRPWAFALERPHLQVLFTSISPI
jgi:hypothetical protein